MRHLQLIHAPMGDGRVLARAADIASWAVGLMAMRGAVIEGRSLPALSRPVLKTLIKASVADSPEPLQVFLRSLPRQKIDAEQLADTYVAHAARHLGDAWLEDRLGFADVTIGCSRLQYILRNIGAAWGADQARQGHRGAVLLLTPPGEQHTLGAMSLMGQLRRRGVSVALQFGLAPGGIRARLRDGHFDAVMLSCSSQVLIGELAGIGASVRNHEPRLPFIVGGGLAHDAEKLRDVTGADLVTLDVDEAIRACGLDRKADAMRDVTPAATAIDKRWMTV